MTSRKDVEQIKTVTIKQGDLQSLLTAEGTYDIRYRIVTEDGIPVSNWTPTISVVAPTIVEDSTSLKVTSLGDNDFSLTFVKKYDFPAYDSFVYFVPRMLFTASPFTGTLRNRVNSTHAIYYTQVPHFLKTNMRVAVAGGNVSYVTANALITAANATSFTMTGGLTTTAKTTNVTADGELSIMVANIASVSIANSEYFFFNRSYDRSGSSTFFNNFNIKNIYAIRTAANVVTDVLFDPPQTTVNLLANVGSSVVKYEMSSVAANACIYLTLQPGTVPEKEDGKPDIITSPNMILGRKATK